MNCLSHEEFAADQQMRFLAAIKNINRWLSFFEMCVEEKVLYCKKMLDCFSNEYGPEVKIQIELKYRELKNLLPVFLNSNKFEEQFLARDQKLKQILRKENLEDFIHMSLNRWFVNQQRMMEYMCYSFCNKYYEQLLHCKSTRHNHFINE